MSSWIVALVLLAPVADLSVGDGGAGRCLAAVRRALAPEYPNDHGDDDFCARRDDLLFCGRTCLDWSCHNDACESWSATIAVRVAVTARGRIDARVDADVPAEEARVRRVLARCLRQ